MCSHRSPWECRIGWLLDISDMVGLMRRSWSSRSKKKCSTLAKVNSWTVHIRESQGLLWSACIMPAFIVSHCPQQLNVAFEGPALRRRVQDVSLCVGLGLAGRVLARPPDSRCLAKRWLRYTVLQRYSSVSWSICPSQIITKTAFWYMSPIWSIFNVRSISDC